MARTIFRSVPVLVLLIVSTAGKAPGQVYEFTADYCGACKAIQSDIEALQRDGFPIVQIDVSAQPELARKHQVSQIPCFFAVRDGQVVRREDRALSRDELIRLCQLVSDDATKVVASDQDNPIIRGQSPRFGRLFDRLRNRRNQNCQSADCQSNDNCQCQVTPAQQAVVPIQYTEPACPPGATCTTSEMARCATVRLRIEDETGHSFGTGTIVDIHDDEALVLTCGHIFRSSSGQGKVICEMFCPNAPPPVEGTIVSYDLRRDIGLVSFRPGIVIKPVCVGGAGQCPRMGDSVFSVGCNRGADPTFIKNEILAVNRYHGPANLVVGGRPVDGRSGGGLFNQDGVLIGVCNAADQEADEGLYAALGPIHAELDRAGLGFVYRAKEVSVATAPEASVPGDVLRSNEPAGVKATPMPNARIAPANSPTPMQKAEPANKPAPQSSTPSQSVSSLQGNSELICVVRDGQNTNGRVFVIDRPSSDLVQQLSREANSRGPHSETQSRLPSHTNGWRSQSR